MRNMKDTTLHCFKMCGNQCTTRLYKVYIKSFNLLLQMIEIISLMLTGIDIEQIILHVSPTSGDLVKII